MVNREVLVECPECGEEFYAEIEIELGADDAPPRNEGRL